MKTAKDCRKCGEWFKDSFGMYQVIEESHDTSLCDVCNREIDNRGKEINI